MNFIKHLGLVLLVTFVLLLSLSIFIPTSVKAQFGGELGAVSASLHWGIEQINGSYHFLKLTNIDTGFEITDAFTNGTFNTGFTVPPGTYTAITTIHSISGAAGDFNLAPQTIVVNANQNTQVDFDAQSETGLVKGSISVNGQLSNNGVVQFCSPGGHCSFNLGMNYQDGPFYRVNGGFSTVLLPGNYILRAGVETAGGSIVDLGSVPVTVTAGGVISDSSTHTGLLQSFYTVSFVSFGLDVRQ